MFSFTFFITVFFIFLFLILVYSVLPTPLSLEPITRSQVDEYKNRATFVHLYGPEPHPVSPATNFDKGIQWQSFWSVVRQPRSYFERRDMAARISDVIHPAQVGEGEGAGWGLVGCVWLICMGWLGSGDKL